MHTSRRTLRAESWTQPAQKAAILRGANAVTISLDSLYFPRRAKSACAIEKTRLTQCRPARRGSIQRRGMNFSPDDFSTGSTISAGAK